MVSWLVLVFASLVSQPPALTGPSFTARVVGISDGDTITVYDGIKQTRIRLEGIDCKENGARYSKRAKQFISDLVFGKEVRVVGKEYDRYDRLVARIYVGDADTSLALIEAGLAWHYKQYSDDPVLAAAELVARAKKVGLCSLPNPIPPWEQRAGATSSSRGVLETDSSSGTGGGPYHGNTRSHVYHAPGCQYHDCKNCTVILASKEEAERQGFRPHAQRVGSASSTTSSTAVASPAAPAAAKVTSGTIYHGNAKSMVYHAPGCRYYNSKNCTVMLSSKEDAAQKGFRPHSGRGGCVR